VLKHSVRMRASVDPSPFSGVRTEQANAARHEAVTRRAFQLAKERNFEPGHELDDWIRAEREYDEAFYS